MKSPEVPPTHPAQELAGLLAIDVPAGDFEQVKAAGYLETARERTFWRLEFWLETGLVTPATTGHLERLMLELGRRLKKLGFGWTGAGAAQMARILLRRITDPDQWAEYWKERLRLDGRVQIHFRSVKTKRVSRNF